MSKRLGEILIERGLIDSEQLREALNSQLVYGGHLGTCLIEHGFVDEQTLGRLLAEVFGVRYAEPREFENIPRGVIAALQPGVAEKLHAVPLRVADRTVEVALIDPKNLQALDEIAFSTGCRVVPAVAPEVRIFQALERYYAIPRRIRYIALGRELDEKSRRAAEGGAADPPAPAPRPIVATQPVGELLIPDASPTPAAPRAGLTVDFDLAAAGDRFCRVASGRELADAMVQSVARDGVRSILFRVKHGEATRWAWAGVELRDDPAEPGLSFVSEPMFTLLLGRTDYRGAVPAEERFLRFYRRLGIEVPIEVLLHPIYLNDRIIAVLYCDFTVGGGLPLATADVTRLAQKFVFAVEMLLIKQKILAA